MPREAQESGRLFDAVVATPVGAIGIRVGDGAVTEVVLGRADYPARAPGDPVAVGAVSQISAYFADSRHRFSVPCHLKGTDFQQRVWRALQQIPPGTTVTYGALARWLGTGARAVGNACRANPCPVLVPCHRVVAAHGGLGGFSGRRDGSWLQIKHDLLKHEGALPV